MKTLNNANGDAVQLLAFNAIMTLPDSNASSVSEFLSYIDNNQFSPIARMHGIPVFRLNDIQTNARCYMSNERARDKSSGFSAVKFSLFGSYLVFTGTSFQSGCDSEEFLVSQKIINVALQRLGMFVLTTAELRLTAQLLSGLHLKDAAGMDNVSPETKRTQMKSIREKLDVGRQQDVIRVLLPELVRLTDPQTWVSEGQNRFTHYANEFLPEDVRCQRLTDKKGRSARIIDYGPLRGKPVLILHSMIFPDITDDDVAFAYQHGLRLIWPLRPGILESTPTPKTVHRYAEETLQGIELAWEHMCAEPVQVIAMVSSAWHAVAFAQDNPDKVADISFAATCFSAGKYENNLVYFGSSVAELCSRNVWLMTKTVDFIRNNVNDLKRFKATISRVFKNSRPDTDILNREFVGSHKESRLMMVLIESSESVKHDYFNQVNFHWSNLSHLNVPIRFIHGAQDSIHKLKDVEKLVKIIGDIPLDVIESAGHIMQYDHFHNLLRICLSLDNSEGKELDN